MRLKRVRNRTFGNPKEMVVVLAEEEEFNQRNKVSTKELQTAFSAFADQYIAMEVSPRNFFCGFVNIRVGFRNVFSQRVQDRCSSAEARQTEEKAGRCRVSR